MTAGFSLALLRHGHTAWNRAGRIQGRADIPLDDEARAQLAALELPEPWNRAELWSSPLARADETARIVAGQSPRHAPELAELHWGEWEGSRGLDLRGNPASGFRDVEDWGWEFRPPGGETPAELSDRLSGWIAALASRPQSREGLEDRDVVAVCHLGVMRVLMARATGWEFRGPAPFRIKRNRLYVIHVRGETLRAEAEPVRLVPRAPDPRGTTR